MRRQLTFSVIADWDEDREGSVGVEERLRQIIMRALNESGSIGYAVTLGTSKNVKRAPRKRGDGA